MNPEHTGDHHSLKTLLFKMQEQKDQVASLHDMLMK